MTGVTMHAKGWRRAEPHGRVIARPWVNARHETTAATTQRGARPSSRTNAAASDAPRPDGILLRRR